MKHLISTKTLDFGMYPVCRHNDSNNIQQQQQHWCCRGNSGSTFGSIKRVTAVSSAASFLTHFTVNVVLRCRWRQPWIWYVHGMFPIWQTWVECLVEHLFSNKKLDLGMYQCDKNEWIVYEASDFNQDIGFWDVSSVPTQRQQQYTATTTALMLSRKQR